MKEEGKFRLQMMQLRGRNEDMFNKNSKMLIRVKRMFLLLSVFYSVKWPMPSKYRCTSFIKLCRF
jgi:hypothetical protein